MYFWKVRELIGEQISAPSLAASQALSQQVSVYAELLLSTENDIMLGVGFTSALASNADEVRTRISRRF